IVVGTAERLVIHGAREHNLKNITLDLPRGELIVFTGISGSGKSSLAFDTIYAEGQRRYVESLSSYARQFLGQMEKPDVDFIEGLSPAISIDQKSTSKNPRSTVGTITELSEKIRLDRYYKHDIEVVVDRLVAKSGIRRRVADSIETALELAEGLAAMAVQVDGHEEVVTFSQKLACTFDGISFEEPAPRNFSFNSPYGACPACDGLGIRLEVDSELVVPNDDLSIEEGAIAPWSGARLGYWNRLLEGVASEYGVSTTTPWRKVPREAREAVLYGIDRPVHISYRNRFGRLRSYTTTFEGVIPNLERRYAEAESDGARERMEQYMREVACRTCKGARLKPESLAVTIGGLNIWELTRQCVDDEVRFLDTLQLSDREHMIAERMLREIRARLQFLL